MLESYRIVGLLKPPLFLSQSPMLCFKIQFNIFHLKKTGSHFENAATKEAGKQQTRNAVTSI